MERLIKTGGGVWEASSDKRLKKDIQDYPDGLNLVQQIRPVKFRYNGKLGYSTDEEYIGVIAQEIQAVAPYMVSEFEGQDGVTYLKFDGSSLVYMLINSVQEQQDQIDLLSQRLEVLEANNATGE